MREWTEACILHVGAMMAWTLSSKFDSAKRSTFSNESNSCFSSYFLQAKSSWRAAFVRMFIFIYFTHSFQQDYHEDDVQSVPFSRICGGSRQRIKYNFEFGCICIEDLVNIIHIVQSVCLRKWSYM
jgi:hypothetical protein